MNPTTLSSSLSPQFLSRVRDLNLVARLVVEGFLAGLHRSPGRGFSVEFAEYRAYMPGDDIRHLDWKLLARTDRYYVKEFEEETNLRAHILLDTSASMGYHSQGTAAKLDYGRCLAAALSFLLLHQHDAVGLSLFSDRIIHYLPPRSRSSHWTRILRSLQATSGRSGTNLETILSQFSGHVRRRGLVILISDLWDRPARVISALKHLRHLKHELLVFHLLDPRERRLDLAWPQILVDMETRQELEVDGPTAAGFARSVRGWTEWMGRECRRHDIDYQLVDTATPFDLALLRYLYKRQRLG